MNTDLNISVVNENDSTLVVPNTGSFQSETPVVVGSCLAAVVLSIVLAILILRKIYKKNHAEKKHQIKIGKKQVIVGVVVFLITAIVSYAAVLLNEKNSQAMASLRGENEQVIYTGEKDGVTLKVEPMKLNVNIKKGEKEKFASTYHNVSVESGAPYGYTLGVYTSNTDISSKDTDTKINGLENNEKPSVLGRNTWGVSTKEPTDVTSPVWYNVPGSENDMRVLKDARTFSEINSDLKVYYGVNAGDDLKSGEYSTTINYAVVPNMIGDLEVQDLSYVDSKETLANPDRGQYIPLKVQYNEETGLFGEKGDIISAANEAKRRNISLVHLRVDLSAWSGNENESGEDLELTSEQVASLSNMLDYFRKFSVKVIVRFSYDTSAKLDKEPKSLDTVMQHLEALRPLFEENKDVITSVDVGILGPWGEMHSTSGVYATDEALRMIALKWLDVLPKELTANVRTPVQYRTIFGSLYNDSEDKYRLGIFNDGYLGSESDLGTFTSGITRDDFVTWMETQGNYTFYGGEVTRADPDEPDYVPEMEQWSEGEFAASEMARTHTSYFNSEFNLKILRDKWQNQTYTNADDEYDGETYFKYITDHIGYRLVLRKSELTPSVETGGIAALRINLENVGFARLIRNHTVHLIFEKDGVYRRIELDTNISKLMSQSDETYTYVFSIPSDMETGVWNVYYEVKNTGSDNYPVKFANAGVYNEDLGANRVGWMTITEGTEPDVAFKQLNADMGDIGETGGIVEARKTYVQGVITYRLSSDNQVILDREYVLLTRGETLNLDNLNDLERKGFSFIKKYYKPKFYSGLNGWQMTTELGIPFEDTETSYWIDIYVRRSPNPDFEVAYVYDGGVIGRVFTNKVGPGAVIDLDDPDGLASMDIVPPTGYRITHFASGTLTGWAGVRSFTMPDSDLDDWYLVNAYLEAVE